MSASSHYRVKGACVMCRQRKDCSLRRVKESDMAMPQREKSRRVSLRAAQRRDCAARHVIAVCTTQKIAARA